MYASSNFKNNEPYYLPSGFILQKDVYTTNLLYANDQYPINKLLKILPFRPPTGRKPQDPSNCLKIVRQNGFVSYNTENETIFFSKNSFKPKKLKNRKLRFPIPKYKLSPLSAMDFYSRLRDKNIRIKYIDDDLNITSKNGKRIHYTFKDKYISNYEPKEKNTKKFIINKRKESDKNANYYSQYFDYGFHSRNKDHLNIKEPKQLNNMKTFSLIKKKVYQKDKTFTTQIDFNLLNKDKKLKVRAKTANVRSHMLNQNVNPYNLYQKKN
jgi:hypothetical protein